MDHPASLPSGGHWRAAALVAAAVAAVELVVLLSLGAGFATKAFGGSSQPAPSPAAASSHQKAPGAPSPDAPRLARRQTSVLVLNGNGQSGAATVGAAKLRRLHYVVAGAANAPRSDFARTLVMYRPAYVAEATRLAVDLGLGARRAVPLDGLRAKDLQGAHIALVLGRG